jgi:predicted nucleotidyltransferase
MNQSEITRLDHLVEKGKFRNRNDGIRFALRTLLDNIDDPIIIQARLIAEITAKIIKNYFNSRVFSVILYGSVAREEMTQDSDIDIAIIIDKQPSYNERIELLEKIDQIMPEWSSTLSLQYYSINSYKKNALIKGTIEYEIRNEGIELKSVKHNIMA